MRLRTQIAVGVIGALLLPAAVSAQVRAKGYVTKNGTYVAPYYRSNPNSTKLDNYSTRGNYNPYTGKPGTKNPYSNPYSFSPSTPLTSSPSYNPYWSSSPQTDSDSDPE
jgi:hypothetical protein